MNHSLKRKAWLNLFIIMCIIVWWSITGDYRSDEQSPRSKKTPYVELFMNEFELTSMDENGRPHYLMTGVHLQRYNNSDITEVTKPVLHLLQQEKKWLVSADTAAFNDKKNTIKLKDNVVMRQQDSEPAIVIRTQKMLIHTKTQIAQTKARVNISQGISTLKSDGMIFNNITSELKLLSKVNGFYVPDQISNE